MSDQPTKPKSWDEMSDYDLAEKARGNPLATEPTYARHLLQKRLAAENLKVTESAASAARWAAAGTIIMATVTLLELGAKVFSYFCRL